MQCEMPECVVELRQLYQTSMEATGVSLQCSIGIQTLGIFGEPLALPSGATIVLVGRNISDDVIVKDWNWSADVDNTLSTQVFSVEVSLSTVLNIAAISGKADGPLLLRLSFHDSLTKTARLVVKRVAFRYIVDQRRRDVDAGNEEVIHVQFSPRRSHERHLSIGSSPRPQFEEIVVDVNEDESPIPVVSRRFSPTPNRRIRSSTRRSTSREDTVPDEIGDATPTPAKPQCAPTPLRNNQAVSVASILPMETLFVESSPVQDIDTSILPCEPVPESRPPAHVTCRKTQEMELHSPIRTALLAKAEKPQRRKERVCINREPNFTESIIYDLPPPDCVVQGHTQQFAHRKILTPSASPPRTAVLSRLDPNSKQNGVEPKSTAIDVVEEGETSFPAPARANMNFPHLAFMDVANSSLESIPTPSHHRPISTFNTAAPSSFASSVTTASERLEPGVSVWLRRCSIEANRFTSVKRPVSESNASSREIFAMCQESSNHILNSVFEELPEVKMMLRGSTMNQIAEKQACQIQPSAPRFSWLRHQPEIENAHQVNAQRKVEMVSVEVKRRKEQHCPEGAPSQGTLSPSPIPPSHPELTGGSKALNSTQVWCLKHHASRQGVGKRLLSLRYADGGWFISLQKSDGSMWKRGEGQQSCHLAGGHYLVTSGIDALHDKAVHTDHVRNPGRLLVLREGNVDRALIVAVELLQQNDFDDVLLQLKSLRSEQR